MNISDNARTLHYSYQFKLPDNKDAQIDLQVDQATVSLISEEVEEPPFWAALGYQQCPNCPLDGRETPYCPVAKNLAPLLDVCSSMESFVEMDVRICMPDRVINAHTTAQRLVSSILGLIMATSPCPYTEYLKPMARFHAPLSNEEEAIYRATSMYLLAQYFRSRQGLSHRYDMNGLTEIYDNLKTVNRAMAHRLRAASQQDAAVNAVILLDLLSQAVGWSIEDELVDLAYLFKRYTSE